jgi:hypothetical protein
MRSICSSSLTNSPHFTAKSSLSWSHAHLVNIIRLNVEILSIRFFLCDIFVIVEDRPVFPREKTYAHGDILTSWSRVPWRWTGDGNYTSTHIKNRSAHQYRRACSDEFKVVQSRERERELKDSSLLSTDCGWLAYTPVTAMWLDDELNGRIMLINERWKSLCVDLHLEAMWVCVDYSNLRRRCSLDSYIQPMTLIMFELWCCDVTASSPVVTMAVDMMIP